MYLTSISVSCSIVASCKQSYEFNNSKHGDRNEFHLISTHRNYIFVYTVAGKDGEKYKGEGRLTFGSNVKIMLRDGVRSYCEVQFQIRLSDTRTSGS